ncbi:MAG: hypothetical protein ACI4KR_05090 [Ruminiclostridium sp.]
MNYPNAAKGLKMMFWAEIASIIAVVFTVIPLIGIIGYLAAIACGVISIVGVYTAGKDNEGYKKAFMFTIISLIGSVIGACLAFIPVVGTILASLISIACSILDLLVTYYIITTSANILRGIGANAIADKGMNVWKIVMICTIAGVIISLLSIIPIISIIAGVLGIFVGIAELVAAILYLIFLYNSYKALGA